MSSSSAYESKVTIKTLVQSETIGKIKIPSFLCKSSLFQPIIRANVPEITFHLYPNVIVPSTFLRVVAAKSLADPL